VYTNSSSGSNYLPSSFHRRCRFDRLVSTFSTHLQVSLVVVGSTASSLPFLHMQRVQKKPAQCQERSAWTGLCRKCKKMAAQSGCLHYCKTCYKKKCPIEHAAMMCRKCKKMPAQSGCLKNCKTCFKKKYPKEHAAMSAKRRKQCVICSKKGELVKKQFCQPCYNARKCKKCDAVNQDKNAAHCMNCFKTREALGATQSRLAMWCPACTEPVHLSSGLCEACFSKKG
jgi:hypothetical protein